MFHAFTRRLLFFGEGENRVFLLLTSLTLSVVNCKKFRGNIKWVSKFWCLCFYLIWGRWWTWLLVVRPEKERRKSNCSGIWRYNLIIKVVSERGSRWKRIRKFNFYCELDWNWLLHNIIRFWQEKQHLVIFKVGLLSTWGAWCFFLSHSSSVGLTQTTC